MRDDLMELQARIREAQEVMMTNGPLLAVLEGRVHVTEVMQETARKAGDRGLMAPERRSGEHRDVAGYDPVLRWHSRT